MVNLKVFIDNEELREKFSKYGKIYGVVFIILGLAGIIFPEIMSLSTAMFFGWLLLFSAFFIGTQAWQFHRKDYMAWLKAVLFTITGGLLIVNPFPGVIALGIIFTAYFFIDSFFNISLAFRIKPQNGWILALVNGILSLILGIIFFEAIDEPAKTFWLVGMLVGISLFFDGIMLLGLVSGINKKQ